MNSASNLRRNPSGSPRRGFTLVELLVVFVVLALLIALLLPAINGAVRSARNAAVSSEISQLAQALAQFKSAHNVYPPSRIILSETGNYSVADLKASGNKILAAMTTAELTALTNRSVSYLRRIWPKMVLSTSGAVTGMPGGNYDFNGDGTVGQVHVLDGAECLVFFLGGLPGTVGTGQMTVTGFSQNPANPALAAIMKDGSGNIVSNPLGQNRSAPMYEFRGGRLVDNYPQNNAGAKGNGFPEYLDGLSGTEAQPFVYFSSYEGGGYDPDDVNYPEEGNKTDGTLAAASWTADGTVSSGIAGFFFNKAKSSPSPNPYTNGAPLKGGTTVNPEYMNKNTFQIFSAGYDGQFGIGGAYVATGNETLPYVSTYGEVFNSSPSAGLSTAIRDRERDNLTNFKGGRLD